MEKQYDLTLGPLCALIHLPGPAAGRRPNLNRMTARNLPQEGDGPIFASAVDHDDLEILKPRQALQKWNDDLFLVEDRNHHRDRDHLSNRRNIPIGFTCGRNTNFMG